MGRLIYDYSQNRGEIEVWEKDELLGVVAFNEREIPPITVHKECKPDRLVLKQDGFAPKISLWNDSPHMFPNDTINIDLYSHLTEIHFI